MIISEEQARLAARYVRLPTGATRCAHSEVPPELMTRIILAIEAAPETRLDRVVEARERLDADIPKPHEIATMIIARTICDALR
jgi:hypothetical protein